MHGCTGCPTLSLLYSKLGICTAWPGERKIQHLDEETEMSKSFPLKVYQSLCKLNQTVSYVDSSGYRACSLVDFLLSVLCLSRHPSGNSITKVWINTITLGNPKDKLRGFHHLNLFKFLMHCQEIYIDQKLQKQPLIKIFSFICMSKFDFCLEAEVVASPFNTVAATSFIWGQHCHLLQTQNPKAVVWEVRNLPACSL